VSESSPALSRVRTFWRRTLRGPSPGARIEIYEELAPTLTAGIGVRQALRMTADRHRGAKRQAVELLADGVDRDVPLSATMREHPETFSPIEAALVATGERTGRLDTAFRAAAAQLDKARATRNRIIQACAYPLFLVHALVATVGMVQMFAGGSFLAVVVPAYLIIWGGLAAVATAHAALSGSPGYQRFLERIPVAGAVVKTSAMTRFARAFAALHGAGMTYDESLRIAADASGSALLRADAAIANYALSTGAPLPAALTEMSSIPAEARGILIAGEQSGELEAAANRVAQLQEERGDVVSKRAISLLPGCLVLIVGLAVGFLAFRVIGGYYKSMLDVMK
jgi:type II secretory pathway component PulF